jgi:hypothetical protein
MNTIGEKIDFQEITKRCRELYVDQLMAYLRADINVFWSWGAHAFTVDSKRNTKMFRMQVSGHHHKGHVYIFLNGSDLFDVYLTSSQGTIKDIVTDLYFDQLVEAIDNRIERIPDYSD